MPEVQSVHCLNEIVVNYQVSIVLIMPKGLFRSTFRRMIVLNHTLIGRPCVWSTIILWGPFINYVIKRNIQTFWPCLCFWQYVTFDVTLCEENNEKSNASSSLCHFRTTIGAHPSRTQIKKNWFLRRPM